MQTSYFNVFPIMPFKSAAIFFNIFPNQISKMFLQYSVICIFYSVPSAGESLLALFPSFKMLFYLNQNHCTLCSTFKYSLFSLLCFLQLFFSIYICIIQNFSFYFHLFIFICFFHFVVLPIILLFSFIL